MIPEKHVNDCSFKENIDKFAHTTHTQYVIPTRNYAMGFNKRGDLLKSQKKRHLGKNKSFLLTKGECYPLPRFCHPMRRYTNLTIEIKQICGIK